MKEADLAADVVAWLKKKGWEVYQEVECYGGVADIVATKKDLLWIVETKTALTFQLVDQARDRIMCADYVSVAVPTTQRGSRGGTSYWVLNHFGIGLLQVDRYGHGSIRESIDPKRQAPQHRWYEMLKNFLEPEHKTFAKAGEKDAKRWTPFKRTCRDAVRYVKKNGPCTLRQLIENIDHHYAAYGSARAHIVKSVEMGLIPELQIDRTCTPMKILVVR